MMYYKRFIASLMLMFPLLGCNELGGSLGVNPADLLVPRDTTKTNSQEEPSTEKPTKVFAHGVSEGQGWYDVNKKGVAEDVMACWLITSAHMLQWWQDLYTASGRVLPDNAPHGPGTGAYGLAIFDDAISKFEALGGGGNITSGLLWYIKGEDAEITGHSYPKAHTGGYLKGLPEGTIRYSTRAFASYEDWNRAEMGEASLRIFSDKLLSELRDGAILGADVRTQVGTGGSLHAITLWGAEVDQAGIISHLYITDSDDQLHQLVRCPVSTYKNELFKTFETALNIPKGPAYPNGAAWEVLRLFYLKKP